MFEQSMLLAGPPSKRVWTTFAGVGGQAVLVACALLAPMVWPQVLPRATFATTLVPPGPPPPPPEAGTAVKPHPVRATTQFRPTGLQEPATIPVHAAILSDPAPELSGPGVPGGVPGGMVGGQENGVLQSIMTAGAPPVPRVEPAPVAPVARPVAKEPVRIRMSSVQMARPIRRVEPPYPQMAKQMRVSGTVELVGVIGTDGTMRELRVVSGHPLLAAAALEAVRQWVYQPTLLNGEPVEVVAPITVNFRLN